MPLPTIFIYAPLLFAAFVLGIVACAQGRARSGIGLIIGSVIITPICYAIGIISLVGLTGLAHDASVKSHQAPQIQQPQEQPKDADAVAAKEKEQAELEAVFVKAQHEAEERVQKSRVDRAIAAAEAEEAKKKAVQAKVLKFQQDQAVNGSPSSQYDLGIRYLRGDGVEQNEILARQWLEKSAAQDNLAAKAALEKLAK